MFLTSANKRLVEGQKQSRYAWVKYFLGKSEETDPPDTSRLYRQTIAENIYDPNIDIDKARQTLLLSGVASLKFLYWDSSGQKWIEKYEFNEKRPPLSIKMILEWVSKQAPEEEPQVFEKIIRPYWPFFDPAIDNRKEPTSNQNSVNP